MPLKISYRQVGWRNNPLRGFSRPKMAHILSRNAAQYTAPLDKRTKTREVMKALYVLILTAVFLIIMDSL